MRHVAPIALADLKPADLSGRAEPLLDRLAPSDLLVDDTYQRGLSRRSERLIRSIVEGWDWLKFKPPVVALTELGFEVVDGQHTAIAAACHPGIANIPVVVVDGTDLPRRARAFVSHAVDRLQTTPAQVWHAAVAGGDEAAIRVRDVLDGAGVKLLPHNAESDAYAPRSTVAIGAIRNLVGRRGVERAREVLAALAGAGLAPISADQIRAGEALLCDPDYAGDFDAERLTAAMRALTSEVAAEARALAAAKQIPAWRALTATLYRRAPRRARAKAPPAPVAQPARVAPAAMPASPAAILAPIAALTVEAESPAMAPRPGNWNSGVLTSPRTPGARSCDGPGKIIMPGAAMARIVGVGPLLRSDGVERLWKHIHGHGLLDPADRLVVVADDKLRAVFGRDRIAVADLASGFGAAFVPPVRQNATDRSYIERRRGKRLADAVEA